jgi:putative flippase GtrA
VKRSLLHRFVRSSAVRFALLGGSSFALNFGITVGLHQVAGVREEIAFAVALATVFTMNFLGMRHFVYPGEHRSAGRQLVLFAISSASFRALEYLAFLVLHTWLRLPYTLVLVVVLGASFVAKYGFYKVWVFARIGRKAPRPAPEPPAATSADDLVSASQAAR